MRKCFPLPAFNIARNWATAYDIPAVRDGRIQKGEQVTMYLTVKNVGKGRSFDTQANIANLSGDGLLLRAGRFDVEMANMMPGDVRRVAFTFDVQQQLTEPEATLSASRRWPSWLRPQPL